ncbi:MAG: TRAP transporter large permease, partial [Deltaproteobacteria bacterium]|nr:TRAP transporter large permease [Deltaproteobacteria bacterium]
LGVWIFMGSAGFENIALHIFTGLSSFVLAPVPLFILMGEVMYHSRLADSTLDVLDRWIGKVPGRLGVLAAASGTLFAATSGSSMANTAMLGTVLLPEMRKRGYSVKMSVGPILGSGGLAILIPPSALAVVLASIAQISVGKLLVAGVIPGILLGVMFCAYIILMAVLRPEQAPPYPVPRTSLAEKLYLTVKHLVPVAFIIFMVIGFIILGLATPTEAAASGAIATVLVSIAYGRLNRQMIMASLKGTVEISVMVFMIIAASKTFSSVLAYTGASSGLTNLVQGTSLHPILVLIAMQLIVALLGCFMEGVSIMMIALPVFMPIVTVLGFDPVWFGVLFLINIELGQLSPPFGMLLFVMKGVAPPDVKMEEIIWSAVPYMIFDILVMALIIVWPNIALWLPSFVKG